MKKVVLTAVVLLIALTCCIGSAAFAETTTDDYKNSQAYQLTQEICETCPDRRLESSAETRASVRTYLKDKVSGISDKLTLTEQTFVLSDSIVGYNLVASLDVKADKQIIIGAHYDGDGAGDNATGVVAVLMIMQRLSANAGRLPVNVTFVLFDGEEQGLLGSSHYVSQMSQTDKDNTLVMFNLDSISNGDNLYLWCENKRTDLAAMIIGKTDKIVEKPYAKGTFNLTNYNYGYTEIPQNSDHTLFRLQGIPVALFFSGTYDASPWQYAESADAKKQVMNTSRDTFENLENNNGEQFVDKINAVVAAVTDTVLDDGFVATAISQRNQLVNLALWYNPWWARLIAAVILIALVIFAVLYYRKLQKQAILGTAEVKTNKVFSTPDAEDIFTFKK